MAGYIVYNGFWNAAPSAPVVALMQAAAARGIRLTPLPNTALTAQLSGDGVAVAGVSAADYALFWDKDVRLARALETLGLRVYNPAAAVAVCDDKAATQLVLAGAGVPMPKTLVAPMTYVRMEPEPAEAFVQQVLATFSFPVVIKECFGSFGRQVYLERDEQGLRRRLTTLAARPFVVQECITASAGHDRRLYVVDDRVAAAMRRDNPTDFRANIGAGGTGTAYTPTAAEEAVALRCCRLLGVGFAGVDLLTAADGSPLVCEVNASAYLQEITACTGIDVAGAIVDYVNGQESSR